MTRRFLNCVALLAMFTMAGCFGTDSNELAIPQVSVNNSGTSQVSPQFAALGGGIPAGVQVTFIGDVVTLRGIHFRDDMKVFLGMNIALARRPDSIFTTARHLLPPEPFVYTDPVTGQETVLEVEAPVEFSKTNEVRITIPAGVACSSAFTNPIVRLYGDAGSSDPVTDLLFIVGPRCITTTPNRGIDIGGFDVTVHGDFLSPHTEIAFRYVDPADGLTKVVGDTAENDIQELFIDRHTLVIPNWPGVVPNSTFGLAEELPVDIILFENIDFVPPGTDLEDPELDADRTVLACASLLIDGEPSPEAPLQFNGVRNSEKIGSFTFLPTGVTDFPSIAGITPESGTEIGGNTVVIHGDQFDAFTADLSNPSDPGIGIECPPGSGSYVAPLEATLVDRQTLVIKMPPCSVDIPETVNFCLRNKFSIDNPSSAFAGPANNCVVFEDLYTYLPIPPIAPPIVTAIHPAVPGAEPPRGMGNDFGLQRFMVVGDWFDAETTLNGGFEFLLPNGEIVQSQRTILHNRNLLEIYTKRLPDSVYPLSEDLLAGVRVRNTIGHNDFADAFLFTATPDAGVTPVLNSVCGDMGPLGGGNDIMVFGESFDTTTTVSFGGTLATDVQFVHAGFLIVTAPPSAAPGTVELRVHDDGDESAASASFTYLDAAAGEGFRGCATLGALDPDNGASTGGYTILAYGTDLSPLTRIEFGVGDGNFVQQAFFVSDNLLRIEVPEALPVQIGGPIEVGATDPLNGCDEVLKTVPFTFNLVPPVAPEIFFVDTTVEVPPVPTDLPALNIGGGDRMLIIGAGFDRSTTFEIRKPTGELSGEALLDVTILSANIAVATAPPSPDGDAGVAELFSTNSIGTSEEAFEVEYVQPGPPVILDVRNLDDGTTTSPIDANDRLLIFGDNFFDADEPGDTPLAVHLTGCDLANQDELITVTLTGTDVTLVEDHLIGVNVPANTFCEGPLAVEVETQFGTATFEDEEGDPVFVLVGPQPPLVTGVFASTFNSNGGEEAIFFGRNLTATTEFSVRTTPMDPGVFLPVLETRFVSDTVAIVIMPALPGGIPPVGESGSVRAEETDPTLAAKISGDPFTVSEDLFTVLRDDVPVLLGVFPDHGSIAGGEQVVLFGAHFQTAIGESNVTTIVFDDPALGPIGTYTQASLAELPLTSADQGKYVILNDHEILLITNSRAAIGEDEHSAAADVSVVSPDGTTTLLGGYTYFDTPAEIRPHLLGITPNTARLNGGSSHLLSGAFLTSADRIVFTRPGDLATFTLALTSGAFSEVNDSFLVFEMPDLSGVFAAGDVLDVHAEKDTSTGTLASNTLRAALTVTFAGPPIITPALSPSTGSAFGGTIVEITGTFFTTNSRVLFGTIPAKHVVFSSPTRLLAVAPTLPVDAPAPGIDLANIHSADGSVDVAVFTQGGWAVLADGYTFAPAAPTVADCGPDFFFEGQTQRVVLTGSNFVPGETTVSPDTGTVANLTVIDLDTLAFDYTAPTFAPGTLGPKTAELEVSTNQGTAATKCELTIQLMPFLTGASTNYTPNDAAAPSTGVESGAFVVATVEGGNLTEGGSMAITLRTGNTVDLTEIGAADAFTRGGQWKLVDGATIEMSVPNVFGANTTTLLDGNPNVGPVAIAYTNGAGTDSLADAYSYVPSVIDFDDFAFSRPSVDPENSSIDKLMAGDIDADGLVDVVALARQFSFPLTDPDAFVFFADTFGDGVDINGDGLTPDFAGTYTKFVIDNDNIKTNLYIHGRGGRPVLANLDDDDSLEIILPADSEAGADQARLVIVDVEADGTLGSETVIDPSSITTSEAISGIAVGNFDDSDDGVDIALTIGAAANADRKIVILASDGTLFGFTETATALDENTFKVGFMESGDFDGDGDDDLIIAQADDTAGAPIVVVEIDASTGSIVSQNSLTNLEGGGIRSIVTFDSDGDGKDEAYLLTQGAASGSFFLPSLAPVEKSGIVVVLDPMSLLADDYVFTGYIDNGRGIAAGDLNGDGVTDVATVNTDGEMVVFFGDGEGGLDNAGRSWTLPTLPGFFESRVHGMAMGDLNNDGLSEVFIGDIGSNPMALIVWLNISR